MKCVDKIAFVLLSFLLFSHYSFSQTLQSMCLFNIYIYIYIYGIWNMEQKGNNSFCLLHIFLIVATLIFYMISNQYV